MAASVVFTQTLSKPLPHFWFQTLFMKGGSQKSEKNAIIEIFVSLLPAYSCIYTMELLNN